MNKNWMYSSDPDTFNRGKMAAYHHKFMKEQNLLKYSLYRRDIYGETREFIDTFATLKELNAFVDGYLEGLVHWERVNVPVKAEMFKDKDKFMVAKTSVIVLYITKKVKRS